MVNSLNTYLSERTATEEYQAVVRSLRRHKGFGLLFIECTPVGGKELITKIKTDLPQKKVGVLSLENPITNLIEQVTAFPNQEILNILFITGLEKSLVEYIRPGYGGKGDYYNLDTIPPILSHLNWQRENFRDQFRHLCFVFILPKYAIKYISLRAPDFFDWSSGVFIFPDAHKVSIPTINPRTLKLFEWLGYGLLAVTTIILLRINLPWPIVSLLVLFLSIFIGFLITGVVKAIRLKKDKNFVKIHFIKLVWRGIRATQFNIQGKFVNKPKNKLSYFDNAIKLDPFYYQAWWNRGIALRQLGRLEEAITAFDNALKIKPDYPDAWDNRGYALFNLGRYEETIASYDNALRFKRDDASAYFNKACAYALQENITLALENLKQAINLDSKYLEMAKTDTDFDKIRNDRRFINLLNIEH